MESLDLIFTHFKRAFGLEGPRQSGPWSSEEDDILAGTPSPNFLTTPTGGRLNLGIFNAHRPPPHGRSSGVLGMTHQPPVRYLDHLATAVIFKLRKSI
ncbi:hypothetical protein TNCV_4230971 [Trichonephila clavipes]|uniref:Uncharacterized protein n=1 Tax=Trichonephila clavipes TaxID=2585209 RepID=A0A8X6SRE5_TRICX|nr:hypothetical protein TNCV_4230971 [Trichonephila clavipes]